MRWRHWYVMLIGTAAAFGAVVTQAAGAAPAVPVAFAAASAASIAAAVYLNMRTRRVVLVGPPGIRPVLTLAEALDDGGFRIAICPGPVDRPCPVLEGSECTIHGIREGVVIFRPIGIPVTPCGEALGVPEVTVDPTLVRPFFGEGRIALPATKSPEGTVAALKAMISHHPSTFPRGSPERQESAPASPPVW